MAAFAYQAINAQGLEHAGELNAPDFSAAREQLRIRGLLAQSLEELPASGEDGARTVFKAIKPKSLQIFSRQFATMIEAGLNVVSALVILEEQTDDKYLAAILKELAATSKAGSCCRRRCRATRRSSTASTSRWSKPVRPPASSTRSSTASRSRSRRRTQIKRRVKGAMIYPTMVLIFATSSSAECCSSSSDLRQDLRPARRPAPEADVDGRRDVEHPAQRLLHHLPDAVRRVHRVPQWKKSEMGRKQWGTG